MAIFPTILFSQETKQPKSVEINGSVEEDGYGVTRVYLHGSRVTLLKADSSFVDSTRTGGQSYDNGKATLLSLYQFTVKPGKYVLKVEHNGYDTKYVDVDLTKMKRREFLKFMPIVYLKRSKVHQLAGVT